MGCQGPDWAPAWLPNVSQFATSPLLPTCSAPSQPAIINADIAVSYRVRDIFISRDFRAAPRSQRVSESAGFPPCNGPSSDRPGSLFGTAVRQLRSCSPGGRRQVNEVSNLKFRYAILCESCLVQVLPHLTSVPDTLIHFYWRRSRGLRLVGESFETKNLHTSRFLCEQYPRLVLSRPSHFSGVHIGMSVVGFWSNSLDTFRRRSCCKFH